MVNLSPRREEGRCTFPHFLLLIAALIDERTCQISYSLAFLESPTERGGQHLLSDPAEGRVGEFITETQTSGVLSWEVEK